MPEIGEQAPDFALPNQDGQTIRLSDFRGQKVILFAYPKADTPGCTMQACGFRDNFPHIQSQSAVILGISHDTPEELKAWQEKINLQYDLLSDVDHVVLDNWGAWGEKSYNDQIYFGTTRSFWVMDENGIVIDGQVKISPEESVERALTAVGG
jgi:thioredoxin-dependent peroxiredoxin